MINTFIAMRTGELDLFSKSYFIWQVSELDNLIIDFFFSF